MTSLKSIRPRYLRTPRLTLEAFDYSSAHYDCLLASMNSSTAHKNMGDFGIRTPEQFDKLNFATRLQPDKFPAPITADIDVYYLMHLGDANGDLMGGVSITQRGKAPPDVGWCVLEKYHGKGYATEAAKELLCMVRNDLGITQIMAWPGKDNVPSINVAKRIGLVEGGRPKNESGEEQVVYVLPGMRFDESTILSLYGG